MKCKKRLFTPRLKIKSFEFKLTLLIPIIICLALNNAGAQESINATGGNASGSGGLVSYSIGQVAYQSHTGTNGSVVEGVQQLFEISVVTGLEEAKVISLSVSAYPNPTAEYLTLSIDEFSISNLSYQLYDMSGKLLQNKSITGAETEVDMSSYVPSTYFVKVIRENQSYKEFKIIKQ
jgi:hypothetical protein